MLQIWSHEPSEFREANPSKSTVWSVDENESLPGLAGDVICEEGHRADMAFVFRKGGTPHLLTLSLSLSLSLFV